MPDRTPAVLLDQLVFPECPRWHSDRLWFSDMHAHRVFTMAPDGEPTIELETQDMPAGLGWLPDGRLLVVAMVGRRLLRLDGPGQPGHVSAPEPFRKLFHQGLILSFAYQRDDRSLVPVDQVEERGEGEFVEKASGAKVAQITAKMSKSLRNVINPDDVIAAFGADTFRLYEMYMGPLESSKPWNTRDISGLLRFLQRAFRLVIDEQTGATSLADQEHAEVEKQLHRTIAKVQADIERLAFNTAIAALIGFVNTATTAGGLTKSQAERFSRVLAPFAPHMAEELWHKLGMPGLVSSARWPSYDEALLRDDQVEVPVQIMGKVRHRILVPADADGATLERLALADPKVQELLAGKTVRKVVTVPGKLINLVAN